MDIDIAVRSLIGSRSEQQDSCTAFIQDSTAFAVICDGMGGHKGGAAASQLAVSMIAEACKTEHPRNIPAFFLKTAEKTNSAVRELCDDFGRRLGAGTTVAAAAVTDEGLYWLSVGDSRIYLFRGGRFTQITEDHTYRRQLEEDLKSKKIDRATYEAEQPKAASLISCLGMNRLGRVNMNIKPLPLLQGDRIVLMSDGLYKAFSEPEITRCIGGTAENTAAALETLTASAGGRSLDNTTFIILEYGSGGI